MRILLMSDLHLELSPFELPGDLPEFDVAVFAGDIWKPIKNSVTWVSLQRVDKLRAKPAILVPGNHEFYGHEVYLSRRNGQQAAEQLGVHLLDPGCVVIDGVRFIGATLWTDFGLLGTPEISKGRAHAGMNDYLAISMVSAKGINFLTPDDTERLHRISKKFIERELSRSFDGPTVVVTHHGPHPNSVPERYRGDALSPAFVSDLSALIEEYQPDVWVHGHDHHHHDYRVGRTRIIANPAGYTHKSGGRENRRWDPRFVFEVDQTAFSVRAAPKEDIENLTAGFQEIIDESRGVKSRKSD